MMAGDWIKMRMGLQTHPKVVRIMSATKSDKFRVIGGLHAVWSVFDQHSEQGELRGYTPDLMDAVIGWPGFSDAMVTVGWLASANNETLIMPGFDCHNGKSAKRRGEDSRRKRESRKSEECPQSVRNLSAGESEKDVTREEKRREENIIQEGDESPRLPHCPHQDIVELYHQTLTALPQVRVMTEARKRQLVSLWKQHPDLEWWRRYFDYCSKSDFLCGRADGKPGKPPFVADLEWITKPSNHAKIVEGKYHHQGAV